METVLNVAAPAKRKTRPLPVKPIAITVAETRKVSGLGNTKIYELLATRELESVTVGRRRLILFASLEKLLGADQLAA